MEKDTISDPIQSLRKYTCLRHQAIAETFSGFPLQDPAQYNLLIVIERLSRGGKLPNQRDLAGEIHRSPATVAASLKVLERQDLIRRTPDPEDQRANRVALTEAGCTMAHRCREAMTALERQVIRGFTPEELDQLTFLLGKMSVNLKEVFIDKKEATSID